MALIHVVIPVYNTKCFLEETIASVLNQPCKDIEIVLVDDGSTDGSSQLCDEIARREPRVSVIHQQNSGVSVARNTGIEFFLRNQEEGYIAFLDSDDLWVPNIFTTELTDKIVRNQADVIGFSACSSNTDASRFRILSKYENKTLQFESNNQTSFLWARGTFAAHMYHIRLFQKYQILFDPICKQNEDVIFSAKLLFCSQKIDLLDVVLYVYRTNVVSATHTAKYALDNADHIPDSWFRARTYFTDSMYISENAKEKWYHFCLETSAIRCLEMVRLLAMERYSYTQIDNSFRKREYYQHIRVLQEEALAPWQQQDLRSFREDPVRFCADYRKWTLKRKIRNGVLCLPFARRLLENSRYTLSLNDLNQ